MSTSRPGLLRAVEGRGTRRLVHPAAWWLWAAAMAVVANRTRNPLLLVILAAVVVLVAELRGEDRERRMTLFLWLGGLVIAIRLIAQMLFGGGAAGTTVLFRIPNIPLPEWTGAVRLGGPVTLEELVAALYSGMSVAAMIICLGAATILAGPRRLLRYIPASLYELGTTVVVGLTCAPQLIDDARAARSARRLRGRGGNGPRELAMVALPVLSGALRRSLALAASMEARGYGRPASGRGGARLAGGLMVLAGLVGIGIGAYGLMSAGTSRPVALGALVLGALLTAYTLYLPRDREQKSALPLRDHEQIGVVIATESCSRSRVGGRISAHDHGDVGARRSRGPGVRRNPDVRPCRTVYRPDPWTGPEWVLTAGAAVAVAAVFVTAATDAAVLTPATVPVELPRLPWVAALGAGVAATAACLTPLPPERA